MGGCLSPLVFSVWQPGSCRTEVCVVLWGVWRCTATSARARRLCSSVVLTLHLLSAWSVGPVRAPAMAGCPGACCCYDQ